jgi:hypothetical protein
MSLAPSDLVYTGSLSIVTCWCGIRHAVPQELRDYQLRQKRDGVRQIDVYCPLGHPYTIAGKGEAEILRNQLASEVAAHDQTRAELRHTEKRRQAEQAAKTRIKNRVANGVCPCCKRTFANVARHMAGQHPGWTSDE